MVVQLVGPKVQVSMAMGDFSRHPNSLGKKLVSRKTLWKVIPAHNVHEHTKRKENQTKSAGSHAFLAVTIVTLNVIHNDNKFMQLAC